MKRLRGHRLQILGGRLWWPIFGLLLLCSLRARGQSSIDLSVIANGGNSVDAGNGILFSTIGQTFASDSLGENSGDATWIGFWQIMPISNPSSVSEELFPDGGASAGIADVRPNPFSSEVAIDLQIPHRGLLRLSVYDLLGREVDRIVDGVREAGMLRLNWHPERLASGNYLLRMTLDGVESPALPMQHYR
jgi:hypothetical protein